MFNIAYYFADMIASIGKSLLRALIISLLILGTLVITLVFTCDKNTKVSDGDKRVEQTDIKN